MTVKLVVDNCKIEALRKSFPQILGEIDVKQELIDNSFTKYFTYEIDGIPVGFIHYTFLYERAELIDIAVLSNYQNQGIASQLMSYMIEDCQKNEIENITLEVRKDNFKAIHLYEKYGFRQVATRKNYYQGMDAWLMEKELIK